MNNVDGVKSDMDCVRAFLANVGFTYLDNGIL